MNLMEQEPQPSSNPSPSIAVGDRFSRWTVKTVLNEKTSKWVTFDLCVCDCGKERKVSRNSLLNGGTTSCGCTRVENMTRANITHGMAKSREYICWQCIKRRCGAKSGKFFEIYGSRGITISPLWANDFAAFYAHIGPSPGKKYSIDRFPNQNGNYEPGNVRWATWEQQASNRRPAKKRAKKNA